MTRRLVQQPRWVVEQSAALQRKESDGITEGHVNRLKMIKRTAYGRASFELLHKRVLAQV